jgi:hypothetical protein
MCGGRSSNEEGVRREEGLRREGEDGMSKNRV